MLQERIIRIMQQGSLLHVRALCVSFVISVGQLPADTLPASGVIDHRRDPAIPLGQQI